MERTSEARQDLIARVKGEESATLVNISGYIAPDGTIYSSTKPKYGQKAVAHLTDDPAEAAKHPYPWDEEGIHLAVIITEGKHPVNTNARTIEIW